MSDEILKEILATVKRTEATINETYDILKIILPIMKDILANLTEEQGGDLVAALRKLTEAVNQLGSQVSATPHEVVRRLNVNGS